MSNPLSHEIRIRVLLIEDNPGDARLFREAIAEATHIAYVLAHCDRLSTALDRLQTERFDIILSDLSLPDSEAQHTFEQILAKAPHTPMVVLTGRSDDELALQAVQAGAQDYLIKNEVTGSGVTRAIRHAMERKRTERRINAQYAITRILSEAEDLSSETALAILRTIGTSLDWDMGELWMVDETGQRLRLVDLWHVANLELSDFEAFTRRRTFIYGDGFSGRVWASGKSVWMADVGNEPGFPPLALAARAGLHGGLGFPVSLRSEVLGVVTFFSRDIRPPDADLLNMFMAIGSQMGQFIERRRAETALRASETKLNYLIRRFVPRAVAEQVMATPGVVQLGGERRTVSVLFADIRGYTALTETLDPPALMDVLNQYFGAIGRVILKHGGTINQYAGDMIMASFNAPNVQENHVERAVRAALEAQAALEELRQKTPIAAQFGMGVNTGPVVVGYLGFEDRFDYATLGETTNIAFRFSSMAEGGQILIGEETLRNLNGYLKVQPLGPLKVKGKEQPLPIYLVEEWLGGQQTYAPTEYAIGV